MSDAGTDPKTSNPEVALLFQPHAIDLFAELLMQMPDPDFVMEQSGMTRADLRRLESDDEITTALETRSSAIKATPWSLEPGTGRDYDLVQPLMEKHFDTITDAAWAAVPYGYSVMEVIYKRDGGAIVWDKIEERPFEWFEPRADGQLRFFPYSTMIGATASINGIWTDVNQAWPGQFFLTRRKPRYRNPYGEALLSRLYWPWFFRTSGWRFWAKFLERFGAPLLIGKTGGDPTKMAAALAKAVSSASIAVGETDTVEAVGPSNAGEAFDKFSNAVDKRIQKVILGQTLTTDVGQSGSYAAAKIHNDVRDDRRINDVRMMAPTIQLMINTLLMLNNRQAGALKFVMEDQTGIQPERADRDSKLATAKIIKFTPEYLMRAYDFEETDFTIPEGTPVQSVPGTSPFSVKAAALLARDISHFTPEQQALERLGDGLLSHAGQPIPASMIVRAIKASTSPEDLAARLAEVYEGNDPVEFRAMLENALFAADVMGYAHQEQQAQ